MKKLKDAIPSMTSIRESKPEPDLTRVNRVWAQLAEMFGNAFYREHGENPGRLWVQAVSRLDDTALVRGLANLANDGLKFPPNLPQFVEACKRLPPVRKLGLPMIEDKRPRGKMSYAEWKRQNDC